MTGYVTPKRLLAAVASSVVTLRPRSFAADSAEAMGTLKPSAIYECTEYIPRQSGFLVVNNHYNAPGYISWWNSFALADAIARHRARSADSEVRWIITAAWRGTDDGWRSRALEAGTKWAFRRVAALYHFITMPPMPPRPDEVAGRAKSVLQAVRLGRQAANAGGIVGLTPEGQDHPGGLGPTPPGAGEFIALLVEAGLPILPAGISQSGSQLIARFGPVFTPKIPQRRDNRDEIVAGEVMAAIARCVSL